MEVDQDSSIEFGRILAHPLPGDEVAITGFSGQFPNSGDVHEFGNNLATKADMFTDYTSEWSKKYAMIPRKTGQLRDMSKFDAGFFGFRYHEANFSDPSLRMLLEAVVSAIFDAGLRPSELQGTNTGVFMGCCFSETDQSWFVANKQLNNLTITECERSMLAHKISYCLKLKGPSFTCDTACSSSMTAIENAYKAIRLGKCDQAIVGGVNLCLHPLISMQFARLGVVTMGDCCKVFDKDGDGYVRSGAVSAVLLQKVKHSKRVYCTMVHAKTNSDGFKSNGITYPSGEMQVKLMKELYQECITVKPAEVSFVEAHGTGTKVGDPEELQAIAEVFLPDRSTPLLVGSVKSNIGHTEPVAGLCSITKAILTMESGYLLPNVHYKEPRPECRPLQDGRMKVVTEKMPFEKDNGLIGVNSFGFGGSNCHILLKRHHKVKPNKRSHDDHIHKLVCVSGRTKEAVDILLNDVIDNHLDVEHLNLLHGIFRLNVSGHLYRGYLLASKQGEIARSIKLKPVKVPKLTICFGNVGEQLTKDATQLIGLPVVSATLDRLQKCLTLNDPSVMDVIAKPPGSSREKILSNFLLQVILADLIKASGIVPDRVVGFNSHNSLGELIAAYWNRSITLKQAVDSATSIASTATGLVSKNGGSSFNKAALREFSVNILNKGDALYEVGDGSVISSLTGHPKLQLGISTGETFDDFLKSLGSLYETGFNLALDKIYPTVSLPVSRATPMISPKIKWSHHRDWYVVDFKCDEQMELESRVYKVTLRDSNYAYLSGHTIDGRQLFPAMGYLYLVWETLGFIMGQRDFTNIKVTFENCKFHRACMVSSNKYSELMVTIQIASGRFEVTEEGTSVVSGFVRRTPEEDVSNIPLPVGVPRHVSPYMNTDDVYKELRLRGYNYKGSFRQVKSCDSTAQVAEVTWDGNWTSFMDNMLQLKILQEDSRLLYVPTGIERLFIDGERHSSYAKSFGKDLPDLPVYVSKESGVVRCGGIEIRGIKAMSISRKKFLAAPVLEKYVFVPNRAALRLEDAIRANAQILLENLCSLKVKVAELIDGATPKESPVLGEIIHEAFADQPLIQLELILISKTSMEMPNIKLEIKEHFSEKECSLVVASKILQRPEVLVTILGAIEENGFILSREPRCFDPSLFNNEAFSLVTLFETDQERLVLFRKRSLLQPPTLVAISAEDGDFTWLPKLQEAVSSGGNVLAYAQGEPSNGLLGLINCIRREPGGNSTRMAFLPDSTAQLDLSSPFYQEQLDKNLAVNVLKNGQWGTYRHLKLENADTVLVDHCYLNTVVHGNLSSLSWLEGPLKRDVEVDSDHVLVSVYYAALNFRDVMTASGKINADSVSRDRRDQECVQGFELTGRTQSGKRVFAIVNNGACGTLIKVNRNSLMELPDCISMEEAATIPVVYGTGYFALFKEAKIKPGESVLIHSGTGGVGQAAIAMALHRGCTVFTTVGTQEKRKFLKERFPQLKDENIASSRDTHFKEMILKQTKGRGVDVVLNSLAGEKLVASVMSLAPKGRFVEIGKFDLALDNELQMLLLKKGGSFHGVMLDTVFRQSPQMQLELLSYAANGMRTGVIRPLNRTVFKMNQAEEAFRYMSTGQHTGKVLIQIRPEENEKVVSPSMGQFPALPRYTCDSEKTYIVCGGLGGFGLELADWLVLRGCRKLVLVSRTGLQTGYQAYRISIWKSYGCTVHVSTEDITTRQGCRELIRASNKLGPVHAIFNLAVVLKDALLADQTKDSFKVSFGPKACATEFLDKVSRELCPHLRDFVVFSSVSCGRGNMGQSNYGMSNSVMERICEQRRNDGLPGLAIEWGAVGDVGLVAQLQKDDTEKSIGGTLQQRITNCLQVLDVLLRQTQSAVVSSIVVAQKRDRMDADNIIDAVAQILEVKDLKTIPHQATLAELGMDSITAVEIKQTLERDFSLFLTPNDMKTMTFGKLLDIQAEIDKDSKGEGTLKSKGSAGIDMFHFVGSEHTTNTPVLSSASHTNSTAPIVIEFPGIEGVTAPMEFINKNVSANIVGIQFLNSSQKDSIQEMAAEYLPLVESQLENSNKTFNMLSYSFGGSVALEVAALLESKGYVGTIICIDSSPYYLKNMTKVTLGESDDMFQVSILVSLMAKHVPLSVASQHAASLMKLSTLEDRMKLVHKVLAPTTSYSPEFYGTLTIALYKRAKAATEWVPDFKLRSKLVLFKPTSPMVELPEADYGLSNFCHDPVEVRVFEGNHFSILENRNVPGAVNEFFSSADSRLE